MRLTKRELVLLLVLGVFLIIYVFHTYLYMPLVDDAQKIREENSELEAITALASKSDEEERKKVLDEKREEFAQLNKKVPENPYLPETIKEIEDMSQKNGVELLKTTYMVNDEKMEKEAENTSYSYKECFFEINMAGSYYNLTKFVRDLEKAERLYTIDRIEMAIEQAAPDAEEHENKIIMNLAFKCYYDNISWDEVKGKDEILYKNENPSDPFAVK